MDLRPAVSGRGYTSTLAVELQHFNSDFVAHVHDFAWVLNAFPRHVGDVQQAINAAQSTNAP